MWYTDLSSLDPSKKNEVWAAQALFYMKRSGGSKQFLDPVKAKNMRATDSLSIDPGIYKQMVDPITPMGGGGKADYMSADFDRANPIYIHLKNIVKADIEKTGKQLEVNLTDKYAKTRQMQENYKILYRKAFRNLINRLSEEIGLPGISDSQDPYKWAENFLKEGDDDRSPDVVNKYVDLIKNQISDDQDLALYNELIYKGDYELAFELGIEYYIMNLNKWQERWADEAINDIMHFNKACGQWYTDLITGRPVIERFVPEMLFTSPFVRKDGEDITYYYTEYAITFGDFFRTVGKNLSTQKLREVFTYSKMFGYHTVEWDDSFYNFGSANYTRDSALIKLGRAAFLTQDMEVQMENTDTGLRMSVDITWQPINSNEKRVEKRYNVWRWWYYLPPTPGSSVVNANWAWQSQFIFELQKFQDQSRYGDAGRYAKSPLVIYDNSSQATFTDIVQSFMPKINHTWQKYQNCLVNDINATVLSDDFIGGILGAVDEDNKINSGSPSKATGGNGVDAFQEQWRMIKQSGKGFLKMRDRNGQPLMDPSKLVVTIKNGMLDDAEKYMTQMLLLYDFMIKSLAFSPMSAGEEVKPRTPVAALEQSLKATQSSRFFIQKGYEEYLKMYAERVVRYIIDVAREVDDYKFPYRWQEFMDNVGYANGLALEGMKDIDPETVGLTVSYVDNTAKKEFIMSMAVEYVKSKQLSDDFLYLIMGVDNWKYAFVLMRMALKNTRKELEEKEAIAHQRAMELKQADFQTAVQLSQVQTANKDQNIVTQGKVDEMVNSSLNRAKFEAQSVLKEQTDQLRRGENREKTEQEKEKKITEHNLEQQRAIEE